MITLWGVAESRPVGTFDARNRRLLAERPVRTGPWGLSPHGSAWACVSTVRIVIRRGRCPRAIPLRSGGPGEAPRPRALARDDARALVQPVGVKGPAQQAGMVPEGSGSSAALGLGDVKAAPVKPSAPMGGSAECRSLSYLDRSTLADVPNSLRPEARRGRRK